MTALTRDAIVDAAARAQYEHDRATRGGDGPFTWPEWDDLTDFQQVVYREDVTPIVTATMTALMPVVEEFDRESNEAEARVHAAGADIEWMKALEAKAEQATWLAASVRLQTVLS